MTVVPLVRLICCHVCGERGELRADGRGLYAPQGWYRLGGRPVARIAGTLVPVPGFQPDRFACCAAHALEERAA